MKLPGLVKGNESQRFQLGLAALTLCGLVLRFRGLSEKPLWQDETAFWMESLGVDAATADPFLPRSLAYAWMWLTHDASIVSLHFLPAVFGGAAVFVFGIFLKELIAPAAGAEKARATGLLGAALLAVWPLAIFYSREARPYGFFLFAVVLLHLAFLRVQRNPSSKALIGYTFAVMLATASHYNASFLLAGFAVVAVTETWQTRDYRKAGCLAAATLVAILPALATIRFAYIGYALSPHPRVPFWKLLQLFTEQVGPSVFDRREWSLSAGILFYLVALAGGVRLWHLGLKRELAVFFSVTIVSLLTVHLFIGDRVFWGAGAYSRYLVHLVVPACALAAIGLLAVARRIKLAYPVLFVLAVAVSVPIDQNPDPAINPFRDMATFVRTQPDIVGVVTNGHRAVHSFAYYYGDGLPFYLLNEFTGATLWALKPVQSRGRLRTMWELGAVVSAPLRGKVAFLTEGLSSQLNQSLCERIGGTYRASPYLNLATCEGTLYPLRIAQSAFSSSVRQP